MERPLAEDKGPVEDPPLAPPRDGLDGRAGSFVSSRTLLRGWLSTTVLGLLSAIPLAGHLLAPAPLCPVARMGEPGLPSRTAHGAYVDAQVGALQGRHVRPADGLRLRRKGRARGRRTASGRPHAPLRAPGRHPRPRFQQPQQSSRIGARLRRLRRTPGWPECAPVRRHGQSPGSARTPARPRASTFPKTTVFLGAYQDTCSDDISYFDLDALPASHQADYRTPCTTLSKPLARWTPRSAPAASTPARPKPRPPNRSATWKNAVNTWRSRGPNTATAPTPSASSAVAAFRAGSFSRSPRLPGFLRCHPGPRRPRPGRP